MKLVKLPDFLLFRIPYPIITTSIGGINIFAYNVREDKESSKDLNILFSGFFICLVV